MAGGSSLGRRVGERIGLMARKAKRQDEVSKSTMTLAELLARLSQTRAHFLLDRAVNVDPNAISS